MMFEDEILEDLDNEEEREAQAAAQEAGGEVSETAAVMQDEAGKVQEAAAETAEAPQQTYGAQQEEAPQQTYTERRASQLQIPAEPQKASGGNSIFKKAVAIALAGVLFGCAAGGTMAGVNALTNRSASVKEETVSGIGQAESAAEESQSYEAVIPTAAVAEAGASIGNDVSGIVEEAMPSVVAINSKMVITQNDFFFGPQKYEASGSGSGIIVGENDAELLLATNNHVVADSEDLQVTFVDGSTASAQVKGTDPDMDLAVVSVKLADIGADTRKAIKVASLGDSNALKLGEGVVAIGNALGEGQSVTVGYVSALNKEVPIEGSTRKLIQVDAAINPGNSGGALLNMRGELIGINSAKLASTEIEGIGYAIPISEAKDIMNNLMTRETRDQVPENEQGYIGIQLQNIDSTMAKAYGMPEGIYVFKIVEGGAASRSDLRERDIITKFDGQTVKTGEELQKMLTYYRGGETVTLTVQSLEGGKYVERQVEVTLGLREETRNMSQSSTEQG